MRISGFKNLMWSESADGRSAKETIEQPSGRSTEGFLRKDAGSTNRTRLPGVRRDAPHPFVTYTGAKLGPPRRIRGACCFDDRFDSR